MPWKELNKMDEREKFIKEMLEHNKPFKQLCTEFGISEKTGYKWKNRFLEQGKAGLYDLPRKPKNTNEIDGETAAKLIHFKLDHPFWGPKKIREIYARSYPNDNVPSLSSVKRILDKAGLVERRRIRKIEGTDCPRLHQQVQANEPNDVWCIDFKGWWKSSGEICEPFTVRDKYSRKILCIQLMSSKTSEAVKAVMTDLFRKYGLPKVIHSDNGTPFSAPNGILNLTNLSAWWITLGILPDRSLKGHPGQNGSLERMHADMAREIENKIPGGVAANQAYINDWVKEYNSVRPNEAIGMAVPDDLYKKSDRKYTGDFTDIEYPLGFMRRKVTANGEIIMNGIRITIGYSLKGLQLGLIASKDDGIFEVYLADFLLGYLDLNFTCFIPLNDLKYIR